MSRTCVVLPTYENAKTVGAVIRETLQHVPDLIVVDDGSTDGTAKVLSEFPGITVVRHERNKGKGAALLSGFAKASSLGFDRVITIDADGQHLPSEIPLFLAADEENPDAIWVGSRKRIGAKVSWGSRFANRFSDFWFWLESGAKLSDTQCGFRSYPLPLIERLRLDKTHYDLEVEVLVKGAWLGAKLKDVPVTAVYLPAGQRVSHFSPMRDFLRISHLYTLFFFIRFFLPTALQKMVCDQAFSDLSMNQKVRLVAKDMFEEAVQKPADFSVSVGLGLMLGIFPIWGIQTLSATLLAERFKLNKFASVVASNISFPAVIPFIFYFALVLGHALLSGQLDFNVVSLGDAHIRVAQKVIEWICGSVVLGILVGVIGAISTYIFVSFIGRFKFKGPLKNA
jgi:uncharacterized protein (DUF2062 family)